MFKVLLQSYIVSTAAPRGSDSMCYRNNMLTNGTVGQSESFHRVEFAGLQSRHTDCHQSAEKTWFLPKLGSYCELKWQAN